MGRSLDYKAKRAEAEAARKKPVVLDPLLPPDPPPLPPFHYRPRHPRQEAVQAAWADSTLLVLTGPAGTGKTVAAIAGAYADVAAGTADRLLVARPVVGVDEDLGFFPGGLDEKLEPWMGAVADVWGKLSPAPLAAIAGLMEARSVGLCRGRTVSRATLVVDEAQNCTLKQLITLCTRPDATGRVVLCGDPDQCDLPAGKFVNGVCPLTHLVRRLTRRRVSRFHVIKFLPEDQQRSPFVREFLSAMGV